MLKQRIITAVLLLLVLVPAMLYSDPRPFMGFTLLLMAAAAWEWARLNGLQGLPAVAVGALCVLPCALAWVQGWVRLDLPMLWVSASAGWVVLACVALAKGPAAWGRSPRWARLGLGLAILVLAWLALVQARFLGINFLLSALVLVWVADIGAYFAGRAWGRRKLAVAISPGKSWEGVWGGLTGVLVLGLCWLAADAYAHTQVASLYTRLASRGEILLIIGLIYLVAMSVVGDLFESLVKRSAGMKDSSNLLPGHGGVLDRIDALLPVLPSAMMLASLEAIL